ncbi:MAG: DUF3078 domain-containing protein [Bacteroidota bacterium]
MKTTSIFIVLTILATEIFARESQDTTYWDVSGQTSLNFTQISFSNWVSGGQNSVSGVGLFNINANYIKDKIHWENMMKAGYGLLKEEINPVTKTDDKLELNSKLGIETKNEHLLYSSYLNFNTQFANGYKSPNREDKISTFFAPAYLTAAAGFDYQPSEKFSLFVTPLSGKFTFVTDEELSNIGAFGVEPGEKARAELGAIIKSELKTPVVENVDLSTSLTLFSNYLNRPENIDVNWDLALNMKINDFLSANFQSTLIYDHDILVPVDNEGTKGRRIQLKQLLGIGFSYNF